MSRFLRDILLFFLVVIIIIGLFFGTRGCGLLDKPQPIIEPLKTQRRLLGPTLAEKNGRLTFRPGAKVWQHLRADADWRELAADAIVERAISALDTLEAFSLFSETELKSVLDSVIRVQLNQLELSNLLSGNTDFRVDISSIEQILTGENALESHYNNKTEPPSEIPLRMPQGNY